MTRSVSGSRPTLIVPAEIQVREWDAKLLLACVAAERGFQVIIGCHARVNQLAHRLPRGYYIAKSLGRLNPRMFGILHQLGHVLLAWDEEAVVYMSPELYLRQKVAPAAVVSPDVLLAWGEDSAQLWRQALVARAPQLTETALDERIRVTGNPRGDLLRPELRAYFEPRVRELRERHGDFLLFNSNFGLVNHHLPGVTRLKPPSDAELEEDYPDELRGTHSAQHADPHFAHFRNQVFHHFLDVLPEVAAAFPDHTLVVRPHPSGNAERWRRALADAPNSVVVNEGSPLPWLLAARALLHNGCTTAVEGFALGCPAVAYEPLRHDLYDIPLPCALSQRATTLPELLDTLRFIVQANVVETGSLHEERQALLAHHIAALDGRLASERIVDVLEQLVEQLVEADALDGKRSPWHQRLQAHLHSRWRRAEKELNAFRPAHHNSRTYVRHRFPDLDVADGERRIQGLGAALGRFDKVRIREWSKNIFLVDEA